MAPDGQEHGAGDGQRPQRHGGPRVDAVAGAAGNLVEHPHDQAAGNAHVRAAAQLHGR